jgi:hypothetical protein
MGSRDSISAYLNGARILMGIDGTYTSGSPGIGFDHNGPGSEDAGFGFTSFTSNRVQALATAELADSPNRHAL